MTTRVRAGDEVSEATGRALRLDRVMPIDDSLHRDDAEEHAAARRFRSLIQAGVESQVTGALNRRYFASLKQRLERLNTEA